MRKTIGQVIQIVTLLVLIVGEIYISVTNIDSTEFRLFVDYWQFHVGIVLLFFIGFWLAED